ncbi:uncharacterized protein L969DRAFT_96980 [Mixia osmundae IAM 14324]|uniref:Uncharacterized protein n=1 Tax=Mixia osmundae (strain CBS 9802 / IAM 14324 / JCM 22182 / KY 12970) TaxID=764103 RepID=G7E2P1_MIXOS|nr:uncharacterized protein L969DRAFT_96980 [Mixia osmundae IAM 14324]KEI36966.1 hypothetical protein L969DRAFT_96980 [Mixia osmundae IAM 14324]GAA97101.1 hypothetical protein E5Q_03776 [Mixia osmundae IAM 14324]
MASLLSGAGTDCGPSNPLQQFQKQLNNDRGISQDQFSRPDTGRAHTGSSFRTYRRAHVGIATDDAARFFASASSSAAPYDLASLQSALQVQSHPQQSAVPAWAMDFAAHEVNALPRHEAYTQAFHESSGGTQWQQDSESDALASSKLPSADQTHIMALARMDSSYSQANTHLGPHHPALRSHPHQMLDLHRFQHSYSAPQPTSSSVVSQSEQVIDALLRAQRTADWEAAFKGLEDSTTLSQAEKAYIHESLTARPISPQNKGVDNDDLARTAGELLQAVRAEQSANPKFASSTFMSLMRKLRDHEVAVEGNKVIEQVLPVVSSDKQKGKMRSLDQDAPALATTSELEVRGSGATPICITQSTGASAAQLRGNVPTVDDWAAEQARGMREMNGIWDEEYAGRAAREREAQQRWQNRPHFQGDGGLLVEEEARNVLLDSQTPGASVNWEEDFDAASIVGAPQPAQVSRRLPVSAQQAEWETLQRSWDEYEATASGVRQLNQTPGPVVTSEGIYRFQPSNPFIKNRPLTQQHRVHTLGGRFEVTPYESILEKEAACQENPESPLAWMELGMKQQENEREDMAIRALARALELDPQMSPAWLALAVSHTNENDRAKAYDAIQHWALSRDEYASTVSAYASQAGNRPTSSSMIETHSWLTGLLIRMAQASTTHFDADVQIALGVLFNISEDYDKAGDCFASALATRPEDPLLFNRLGATLANSGKPREAIEFYNKAIELQPAYARARYNLAVSSICLSSYDTAAVHLLRALQLQNTEAAQEAADSASIYKPADSGAVTSEALWSTLRMVSSL